jgi:hypothetical protein
LRGIIYLGAHHFTAHIVTPDRNVWYHDGISTGQSCLNEGYLSDFSINSLMTCKSRQAVVVVYAKWNLLSKAKDIFWSCPCTDFYLYHVLIIISFY